MSGKPLKGIRAYETELRSRNALSAHDDENTTRFAFNDLDDKVKAGWAWIETQELARNHVENSRSQWPKGFLSYSFHRRATEDVHGQNAHTFLNFYSLLDSKEQKKWEWIEEQAIAGYPLTGVSMEAPYVTEVASCGSTADQTLPAGIKDDELKLRYHLLPNRAIEEVVGVLMYGAEKYEEGNWMKVDNAHVRYFNAAIRHLWASLFENYDPETGFHHLAHAACCVLFSLHLKVCDRPFHPETLRVAMAKGREIKAKRGAKT